jgi:pimeloyl-ACP methyl ester carboxylesterase
VITIWVGGDVRDLERVIQKGVLPGDAVSEDHRAAVLYNPIGLTNGRFDRPMTPIDEAYRQTLESDYQSIRASLGRDVAHNPKAWNADFETYTRIRYSWTLRADWPRLVMVQALVGQMLYADPVVYDWAHIHVSTLAFGGAEDTLPGSAARFQERMQDLARTITNGNGRVLLLPSLGHVPHLEAPGRVLRPLIEFLKRGAGSKVKVADVENGPAGSTRRVKGMALPECRAADAP